jgi:probable phosphoglycerate mutase
MATRAIFVRHGESQANIDRIFANRPGPGGDLTAVGITQAHELAMALRRFEPDHVFSSPLPRAAQTADVIAGVLGIPMTLDDALREYDVGDYEGLPYHDKHAWRWQRYETVESAWLGGDHDARHPGGESLAEVDTRFRPLMARLVAMNARAVVAVGHGGLFRIALPLVLPNVSPTFAASHGLGHGDMVIAMHTGSGWRCERWAGETLD